MDQLYLLDANIDKFIVKCVIKRKGTRRNEVHVQYDDGSRERIWTYDPNKQYFEYADFIGMTKIEAVFFCDGAR